MQSTIEIRYLTAVVNLGGGIELHAGREATPHEPVWIERRIQDIELKLDIRLFHRVEASLN